MVDSGKDLFGITTEEQYWLQQAAADQLLLDTPDLDYYDHHPPDQPKFEVGGYVRDELSSEGIDVPLIDSQSEWEEAIDDGTAMLRSDHPQDYAGLSGLLNS